MTQASENSPPRNESGLSNIKSIGPARAQLLQELLAIHTIHDLAEASAHLIEAALREASRPVQHNIIAQWIEHARHLATADRFSTIEDKTLIKKALVEWQTQTVFTVEFQTRDLADSVARQIRVSCQDPEATASFSERDWRQLQPWMLEHVPPTEPPVPQPEMAVTLRIGQVIVLQPPDTGTPIVAFPSDRSLSSPLLANQPFELSVSFELPELEELSLPAHSSYYLEGFVKTLAPPHRVIPLGESQLIALVPHRTQYSVSIAKSTLPSGLYRLQLLISFQGVRISFGVHEIQRFQVGLCHRFGHLWPSPG